MAFCAHIEHAEPHDVNEAPLVGLSRPGKDPARLMVERRIHTSGEEVVVLNVGRPLRVAGMPLRLVNESLRGVTVAWNDVWADEPEGRLLHQLIGRAPLLGAAIREAIAIE